MRDLMFRRAVTTVTAVLVGGVAAVALGVDTAWAHVTVNPSQATQGGFTKLAFRVPNEKDTASTTKVEVFVPTDAPIASVAVKPVPGWTAMVEKTKLPQPVKSDDGEVTEAVSRITWTANDAATAIQAGQFQEFEVSAGPLPKVNQIVFKALQTYSDGEVVRWIDEPTKNGIEPEHPAPVLTLVKASGSNQSGAGFAETANLDNDTDAYWGIGLGIAGLAVGAAGLSFGLLAWRRGNRPAA
jgi:uncharacterized protein YcnI